MCLKLCILAAEVLNTVASLLLNKPYFSNLHAYWNFLMARPPSLIMIVAMQLKFSMQGGLFNNLCL